MLNITTRPIGGNVLFLEVYANDTHVGYLEECHVLGWQAYLGTDHQSTKKIGAAYRLDRAKQFFADKEDELIGMLKG